METCRLEENTFLLAIFNQGLFGNARNFKAKRAYYLTVQSLIEIRILTSN